MDRLKAEPKPRYKSYRKKYQKVRSRFNKALSENNAAWDREQNMQRVVRRLEEELDQLRELLIDVNESKSCPKHLAVSLTSQNSTEDAWLRDANVLPPPSDLDRLLQNTSDEYHQAENYCAMFQEFEQEMRRGECSRSDYGSAYKAALPSMRITRSLAYLEDKVPHTKLADVARHSLPQEITEDTPIGYLHPDREAEYLERLDAEIADRWSSLGKLVPDQRLAPGFGALNHAARDNPTSALNWLRKHQPDVFLDPGDAPAHSSRLQDPGRNPFAIAAVQTSTSASRRENGRAKRGSQAMQEVLDEDGSVIGLEPTSRQRGASGASGVSKRKRGNDDDDISYHPSKGTSSVPKKRVRKSAMEMAAERD